MLEQCWYEYGATSLQVAQLKVENSSLLRRLATLNQKYTDATVDNRVLKANMETLRTKVYDVFFYDTSNALNPQYLLANHIYGNEFTY
jgi:hypothetical protein